ncbi:MAG TPA: COX15/CtaA family protein [Xanthobacteraceae bacterium]|nr:COX15/CtaA family protein [Xanthobacteraceae bacterium]
MTAQVSDRDGFDNGFEHSGAIRLWLYAVGALVLAMVLVGGATRLTESGLSITEWQPVMGTLPPLDDGQWQAEFEKYQAIPQYRQINGGMSLEAFKTIYWWEWTHRIIGRTIGVAFLLPLLWFLWHGWIPRGQRGPLWTIFGLGALQGAVGWWMVASGLADRIEVSQYRLAVHLVLACFIYVAVLWTARRWGNAQPAPTQTPEIGQRGLVRGCAIALLVLILLQIYLGALVAGLRAGHAYHTWPLIDGALVPQEQQLFFDVPLWRNFFENPLTVQFDHRMLAYGIWALAVLHALNIARVAKKGPVLTGAVLVAIAVTLQAALGIWALLSDVPLSLALMHQAMAMVTLTLAVIHVSDLTPRRAPSMRLALSSP